MDKTEKTLSKKEIYNGHVIHVHEDTVLCPNGNNASREIVDHNGGVAVFAILDNKILIESQYRYALKEEIYEIPAGKLEKGEIPIEAARRELLEETGFDCENLIHLGDIYPTPGYSSEIIYIYLAENLIKKETNLDEDEIIEYQFIGINEYSQMISDGKIKDAKSICALQYYLLNKR